MGSKTTLVAKTILLHRWAEQIRACNNRPEGMNVTDWCAQNGITKSCYYYRLRQVRKACLDAVAPDPVSFVELPAPVEDRCFPDTAERSLTPSAIIRCGSDWSIELLEGASAGFLKNLIGVMHHAE